MLVAAAFRLSTLGFLAAASYGLWRMGTFLWERGLPLAILDLFVVSTWVAIAIATVEVWSRSRA